ncbi:MAG: class I SAM-dependent methyltransferase, partial [Acidimicrobiales bacterium]
MGSEPYDPTLYRGSAVHYRRGRPPYSAALVDMVTTACRLDGTGRLLDVGCGPGTLAVELAPLVDEATGLDPDADMLAEAERHARDRGRANLRWVRGLAEEIPVLGLGRFRLVTFGQSFHRASREAVAEIVYDILDPGGSIVLVSHTGPDRPAPAGPGQPPIPHAEIRGLID